MIKFEYNMLVLNNAFSEEDVQQIGAYAEYVRKQERERIIEMLKNIDDWSGVDCEYVIKEIAD
jgi:hypothetical protein